MGGRIDGWESVVRHHKFRFVRATFRIYPVFDALVKTVLLTRDEVHPLGVAQLWFENQVGPQNPAEARNAVALLEVFVVATLGGVYAGKSLNERFICACVHAFTRAAVQLTVRLKSR